ncbi:type II toxin-antitoxin system VapC family toxin [uncultured Imperialibacter sp.]|uniref:type II toxin-antitoxin system tRNA(fMet)-specific endonuclease VapC n=1 Tax=uncultured Imperialibacter sp. TaxID=1672639 RepID=UPI0030DC14F2
MKQKPLHVFERFRSISLGEIGISSITLSELNYGVMKSALPEKNKLALAQFLVPLEILPFNEDAAIAYGRIRADLENKGTPIGPLDTLIAAHALSLNQTLVTNNEKEFARVISLKIENWA